MQPTALQALVRNHRRHLDGLISRARTAAERKPADGRRALVNAARLLEGFSFERTLDRGFALVRDKEGHVVRSSLEARAAKAVTLRFSGKDEIGAKVETGETKPVKPAGRQERLL